MLGGLQEEVLVQYYSTAVACCYLLFVSHLWASQDVVVVVAVLVGVLVWVAVLTCVVVDLIIRSHPGVAGAGQRQLWREASTA